MKVKIFFTIVSRTFDHPEELEKDVNRFLEEHPGATAQWLQSSAGAAGGIGSQYVATTITAIITY